jgi:hypothetical protein
MLEFVRIQLGNAEEKARLYAIVNARRVELRLKNSEIARRLGTTISGLGQMLARDAKDITIGSYTRLLLALEYDVTIELTDRRTRG